MLLVLICMVHFTGSYYLVKYAFLREYTFYKHLNAKELLARKRGQFQSLSDCNGTPANNHLVRKLALIHMAKLTKFLSCVVITYLYWCI